eukprot:1158664-Pelagomonas_calceolata.AAC.10
MSAHKRAQVFKLLCHQIYAKVCTSAHKCARVLNPLPSDARERQCYPVLHQLMMVLHPAHQPFRAMPGPLQGTCLQQVVFCLPGQVLSGASPAQEGQVSPGASRAPNLSLGAGASCQHRAQGEVGVKRFNKEQEVSSKTTG